MVQDKKKTYNIEKDNINLIDSSPYNKMRSIEKVSQTFLMKQISENFHNKQLVSDVRREISESNNLIKILEKIIKGIDSGKLDLKGLDKLLRKLQASLEKRELIKSKRSFDIDLEK